MNNSDNKKSFSLDNFFANLDFYDKLKVFKELVIKAFLNYMLINIIIFILIFLSLMVTGGPSSLLSLLFVVICFIASFYLYSYVILKVLSGDSSLINLAQIKSLLPNFLFFAFNFFIFIFTLQVVLGLLFLPFHAYQQEGYGLFSTTIGSVHMAIVMLFLGIFLFTFTANPKFSYFKILSYIYNLIIKNKKDWLQAGLVVFVFVFIQNNAINILLPCPYVSELNYQIILNCMQANEGNVLMYLLISVLNYLLIMSFIAVTFKKCESLNKLNKIKLI